MKAIKSYLKIRQRKYLLLVLLAVACMFTLIVDISTGPARLPIFEVFFTILSPNHSDPVTRVIVWDLRLPIALMAIAVGATLSVAGAEMQTILDNPLASPFTMGVSGAAGFGAALAIVLGKGLIPYAGAHLIPVNAFIFSLLSCLLIYFIVKVTRATAETMVLAGIALLFLFNSLLALLQYKASPEALQAVVFWLFGSLQRVTWPKLATVSAILFIVTTMLSRDVWKLTALRLGDEKAKSLGINVERLRIKVMVLISLLTAGAVCFVGVIGFIGLVGPHIARMLVGEEQRFFLPMSALCGAFVLSTASIASKLIEPGAIIPIGIVTSLVGIPFFLSLLLTRRRIF